MHEQRMLLGQPNCYIYDASVHSGLAGLAAAMIVASLLARTAPDTGLQCSRKLEAF